MRAPGCKIMALYRIAKFIENGSHIQICYHAQMVKKSDISDDEHQQFLDAMKGVKPLPKSQRKAEPDKEPPRFRRRPSHHPIETEPYEHDTDFLDYFAKDDWHGGEDCIDFARTGVSPKTLRRLRRGQLPIEASLDLHRHTGKEALSAADQFISRTSAQGKRLVLIVHGKGHFSDSSKPLLKNIMNHWLRRNASVLAFHSAKPKDGGTGAVYVLLKSR